MSTKLNLQIDQNSYFNHDVIVKDQSGNPFDFTGYDARGQMRKHHLSNTAVEFTVSLSLGNINMYLNANSTSNVEPGRYMYDVMLIPTDENLQSYRILEGVVTLTPGITR